MISDVSKRSKYNLSEEARAHKVNDEFNDRGEQALPTGDSLHPPVETMSTFLTTSVGTARIQISTRLLSAETWRAARRRTKRRSELELAESHEEVGPGLAKVAVAAAKDAS